MAIKKLYLKPWEWSLKTLQGYRMAWERRLYEELTDYLANESPSSFLDLGFGGGAYLRYMVNQSTITIGVEISFELVRTLKNSFSLESIDYVVADAENLPFRNESFDCILCNQVLEHLPFIERAINELHRVTKPDGKVICTVPNFSDFTLFWVSLTRLGLDPVKIGKNVMESFGMDSKRVELSAIHHPQKRIPTQWMFLFKRFGFYVDMRSIMTAPHFFDFTTKLYEKKVFQKIIKYLDKTIGRIFPFNMLGQFLWLICVKK
jgi:ubiquinone/menaquinone biosynthesis C-methylase UbiE